MVKSEPNLGLSRVQSFRPVILCGGSGTRLWPLSRAGFPKQFLCLTSNQTLFQEALGRLLSIGNALPPIIVCNEEHRFLVQGQLDELANQKPALARLIHEAQLLLEPEGRNTAPALTLAALATLQEPEQARSLMVVTPADQTIHDLKAFEAAIELALKAAQANAIVTLGVPPDRPETGYGYMKVGGLPAPNADREAVEFEPLQARDVLAFTEKPSADKANAYLNEGNYFWNAGMFILKAEVWLSALQAHRPDILAATKSAWESRVDDDPSNASQKRARFIRPDKTAFLQNASESIDYAVMEPSAGSSQAVKLIPLEGGWSDLGAWDAVWEALPKDNHGNSYKGDVLSSNCENTFVHANSRLVSLVGVKDLVIIETADAVLVTNRQHSQDVKTIVEALKASKREERELHRKVHRPWGWYDSIDEGERFKVKRIQVKPGASLSLQKHHHRAEHWIVVKGTAEITIGERVVLLSENQSTYIPLGETHRLANPGTIPLEIIEVQSGSYLGEDDIVRFEDQYGR
jgi:mannose-1-phosphate guanylyltransferase / mannose-6-phosphate isomerase